jgi:hypothetical protein
MPNCLDDYYQELLTERDEEIYRLREELSVLKFDLSDAYAYTDQLERELNALKSSPSPLL